MLNIEDYRINLKFKSGSVLSVSPFTLTITLRKALGDIEMAKVLRDGSLLVELNTVCKKEIARGGITGISVRERLEEMKKAFMLL